MQHICNFFLRHNSWDVLTSRIDIPTQTSSRHFNVSMFQSEHIIPQTCSSSSVFYFRGGPTICKITQSRGLGLALCFPPLPILRPADSTTIFEVIFSPSPLSLYQFRAHFSFFPTITTKTLHLVSLASVLSIFHTATTVIFLKWNYDYATPLLKTIQRFFIALRIKYDLPLLTFSISLLIIPLKEFHVSSLMHSAQHIVKTQ